MVAYHSTAVGKAEKEAGGEASSQSYAPDPSVREPYEKTEMICKEQRVA